MKAEDTYKYFLAADLIAFPGLHSVYWEQAVGAGCACVFRRIPGVEHVDLDGNCTFFDNVDTNAIRKKIQDLLNDTRKIENMKNVAQEKGKIFFSYEDIARRSISQ